jgi:lambda repressor-like predicted transcriptional regulator
MDIQVFEAALKERSMSKGEFCREADIDWKSLNGYIDGSINPRDANKNKVAKALGLERHQLWPEDGPVKTVAYNEIVNAWSHRSESPMDLWWNLLQGAKECIDLLGNAMQFLHEDHSEVVTLLKSKAIERCKVRIIIPSPEIRVEQDRAIRNEFAKHMSILSTFRALHKDRAGSMPAPGRIPQLRYQKSPIQYSMSRFDDDMLVSTNLYNQHGRDAPLFQLHLDKDKTNGIFTVYAQNFEEIFQDAVPCS